MTDPADDTYGEGYHVLDLLAALAESWLLLLFLPLLAALTALGATALRSTVAEQTWATVTIEAPRPLWAMSILRHSSRKSKRPPASAARLV